MRPPSPGWWPDPTGRHEHRYWDGARWTGSVSDRGAVAADPAPVGAGPRRSRAWTIGAIAGAAALVAGIVVAVERRAGEPSGRTGRSSDAPPVEIPVGHAREIAVGAGAVWVVDDIDDLLVRIDPAEGEVTDEIPIEQPRGLAVTDDAVWVGNDDQERVTRVDPATLEIVAEVALPGEPDVDGVVANPNGAWVVTSEFDLVHIDAETNDVVSVDTIDADFPHVAVGSDALWITVAEGAGSEARRLDRHDGELTTIDLTDDGVSPRQNVSVEAIAAGEEALWVVRARYSIDPMSLGVDLCRIGSGADDVDCTGLNPLHDIRSLAVGEGAVWATSSRRDEHRILRFDADTRELTDEIAVPAESFFDLATGEGAVWATNDVAGGSSVIKLPA